MKSSILTLTVLAVMLIGGRPAWALDGKMTENNKDYPQQTNQAVFAGGCFWCTESDFEKADGVIEVISGYTGGDVADPTYEQVSGGGTGHVEAVKIVYDPAVITYEELLELFWRHVDPTDAGGQFVDRGSQYRSVIFYADDRERRLAESSRERLAASGRFRKPIATEILPLGPFYPAEEYHQDYYKKNPLRYRWYRFRSGRDQFLEKTWADPERDREKGVMSQGQETGDQETINAVRVSQSELSAERAAPQSWKTGEQFVVPNDEELRRRLTPRQYKIIRKNGTEPPFDNQYWNNHDEGIYVDLVSGEPLFSSLDKFDSGTGWPSFSRPLDPGNIVEKLDRSLFMVRTEVRSRHGDSHLGHLFDDGPEPTGLRYCINSAALRFIPKSDLEAEGYGEYRKLFD